MTNNQPRGITQQFGAFALALSIIWGGGISYQRLVALESWKHDVASNFASQASVTSLDKRMETEIARLEADFDRKLDTERESFKHKLQTERAFIRHLCKALTHVQKANGLPETDDCGRP